MMKDPTVVQQQQQQQRRASVPAFGGWDDIAAAAEAGGSGGATMPDYSLDFSKMRSARVQRRTKAMSWSTGPTAAATEEQHQQQQSSSTASGGGSEDRDEPRRRRRHRRHHSDATGAEARQPIRAPPNKQEGRSNKLKGYLFGCMGRWYVGHH